MWHETPEQLEGGQDYPAKVLREEHRNIRAWLQDGSNDQENPQYGSWPLANLAMANALKLKGYDFHFSFGTGPHTASEGGAEFAQEMIWLWRGYDPAKTSETFSQEQSEMAKPPFRVAIVNR
jgi:enterochelin esterase family protein